MAAASDGVTSKECGSSAGLEMIDFTDAWSPAMALATLPHTFVDATTDAVACWLDAALLSWLQPTALAIRPVPKARLTAALIARMHAPNTNENRFQLL